MGTHCMMTSLSDAPVRKGGVRLSDGMRTAIIDSATDASWDRLVDAHPAASFFHRSAWARVIRRTYGHQSCCLVLREEGQTRALLPLMEVSSPLTGRRGVCVPFADECSPLLFDEDDRGACLDALRSMARERRWRYFELRGGSRLEASATPSASFLSHALDLSGGIASLFDGFDSSVRRAIRKAERSGLRAEIRTDRAAMIRFYELHARTRRRHGLPPQPLKFFLNIQQEIIEAGMGMVVLVSNGETPAAAAIFFTAGAHAVYKFGACDERIQESRANNLAMWTGIRHLAEQGCGTLHFGRTSRQHEGLRRYKLGWGATETTLDYFKFSLQAHAWVADQDRVSGIHNAVFSRLPIALNRWLGNVIYPHLT